MANKALVAMSGGVDSSVAAWRMVRAGYDCMGVTMKLLPPAPDGAGGRTCCTLDDAEDARAVAFRLGMPHYVWDFSQAFREAVMDGFAAAYEAGDTPNPCIACNRHIKFGALWDRAETLGCGCIATGHYARIERRGDRWVLRKALDADKDQTYFLYFLSQAQLARTRFPLGDLTKAQVRALAAEQGFFNAKKPDSQDICFVPDGDYGAFLERHTGRTYPPGDFLDQSGHVVGRHRGAVRYTVGQRRGLGLAMGRPVYVCGKDMAAGTVTVGPDEALYRRELYAGDWVWSAVEGLERPMAVRARIRSCQREQPATVYPESGGLVRVVFDRPQRAVATGQAVVLYAGDQVLAGGTIAHVPEPS